MAVKTVNGKMVEPLADWLSSALPERNDVACDDPGAWMASGLPAATLAVKDDAAAWMYQYLDRPQTAVDVDTIRRWGRMAQREDLAEHLIECGANFDQAFDCFMSVLLPRFAA